MAVFLELVTEAAANTSLLEEATVRRRAGLASVRRPLRGIEVKDDTYAIFRAVGSDGTAIPMLDSGHPDGLNTNFANFLIQSVQEARVEKAQLIETFGATYVFFFGEQPRFLDVTAILPDSADFNWKAEFLHNYDRYLRGSKLTELGAQAYLFYNDLIVAGYLMQCMTQDTADTPALVQLSFKMLLTQYHNISVVGDPDYPIRAAIDLPAGDGGDFNSQPDGTLQDLSLLKTAASPAQLADLIKAGTGINGTVVNGQFVPPQLSRSRSIRGLIADNSDEWTGEPPVRREDLPDPSLFVSTVEEVADLNAVMGDMLSAMGADPNYVHSPGFIKDSGFGPNFKGGGVPMGFGSSGPSGVSFNSKDHYQDIFDGNLNPKPSAQGATGGASLGVGGAPALFVVLPSEGEVIDPGSLGSVLSGLGF